ncbi:hypothetical protein NF27_CZ00010, partial [Candidatus Jidaibacter acanthamoeba]
MISRETIKNSIYKVINVASVPVTYKVVKYGVVAAALPCVAASFPASGAALAVINSYKFATFFADTAGSLFLGYYFGNNIKSTTQISLETLEPYVFAGVENIYDFGENAIIPGITSLLSSIIDYSSSFLSLTKDTMYNLSSSALSITSKIGEYSLNFAIDSMLPLAKATLNILIEFGYEIEEALISITKDIISKSLQELAAKGELFLDTLIHISENIVKPFASWSAEKMVEAGILAKDVAAYTFENIVKPFSIWSAEKLVEAGISAKDAAAYTFENIVKPFSIWSAEKLVEAGISAKDAAAYTFENIVKPFASWSAEKLVEAGISAKDAAAYT